MALFVELVNGASSVSQLVKKVLDFISKILVFSLYNIKLFHGFIPGCLKTEELAVVVSAFLLAGINFCSNIIGLCLPFTDNLVKVLATSFSDDCSSVDTLVFKLEVFEFSLKTVFSLFGAGNLLVEGVDGFFSLIQTSAKFLSSSFQFFDMSQSFGFVLGSPQLHFSGGLGQSFKGIRFLLVLFINLLLQVFKLSSHVLEFAEKGCTISSFAISKSLGIFQLGGKRNFGFSKRCNSIFSFFDLAAKVLVLYLKFLLGGIGFIQGTCHFIQLLVSFNDKTLGKFSISFVVSSFSHDLIKTSTGFLQVTFHSSFVFFSLGFHLIQAIDLLSQFRHVVVVLLSKSSKGTFMGNV